MGVKRVQLFQFLCDLFFFAAYVRGGSAFPEPLPEAEERRCLLEAARGSEEAREKLIAHNLRLVAHIGLIKAGNTFDPGRGYALSAYASRCVENEIRMSLRAERRRVQEVSLSDAVGTDGDGNDVTLLDMLGTDPDAVLDQVQARLDTERICGVMRRVLTEREATVIRLRFGLFGACRMAQREVAELLGISRSYISRIEKKALGKLNAALRERR